jgi:glycosyltransferase involved in cell wall biosynthesis
MDHATQPLVSIGVPVYNGAAKLAAALDSLLRQDYERLEIIISDNGSTDATPEIAREYAARDARVRYFRSDENRGATWNFNRVFELSAGKYFTWAAHDDVRDPSFIRECVEKLEASPNAALCHVYTATYIEGRDRPLFRAQMDTCQDIPDLFARYRETIKRLPATAIYGVYRASVMRQTKIFERSIATDVAFNQEVALYGEWVEVPKLLSSYSGREKWNTIHDDYRVWLGKPRKPWWYVPFVALFWNHARRVARAPLSPAAKLRLWGILVEHHAAEVALKVLLKAGRALPASAKERLGPALYWRWMHNPNIKVLDAPYFVERVIKPKLGWWR